METVEFSATILGYHPKHGELIAASAAKEMIQLFYDKCEQLQAENEALKGNQDTITLGYTIRELAKDNGKLRIENEAYKQLVDFIIASNDLDYRELQNKYKQLLQAAKEQTK